MEIITGVERRRRWRPEQKLRILAELDEPGAKLNAVARRYDLSRALLWQWRDAQRRGKLAMGKRQRMAAGFAVHYPFAVSDAFQCQGSKAPTLLMG
jgi:transposase